MSVAIGLGLADTNVVNKFTEFSSKYQTITEALSALLLRSNSLTKKYWFLPRVNETEWILQATDLDQKQALSTVLEQLDDFVVLSHLDNRASAIEELLFSPDCQDTRTIVVDIAENLFQNDKLNQTLKNLNENELREEDNNAKDEDLVKIDAIFNCTEENQKALKKLPKKRKRKLTSKSSEENELLQLITIEEAKSNAKQKWRRTGSSFIDWFVCIVCSEKMEDEKSYRQHIQSHEGRSPICTECGNYFANMELYEEHLGNYTTDSIFHCSKIGCKKKFQFKCKLECHERSHVDKSTYVCNDCGIKLASSRSMIRHVRGRHLNENPYSCHMCPKAYPTQPQLTKHLKTHTSPKFYLCDVPDCSRTFTSKQGLVYHKLDHAGLKPHKCKVCGKAFRTRTDMLNHERIHSGERPFTCELCGKSFVERNALRKHRTVHTKEKNYICSYCGRQFGYKCSLDGHMRKCGPDAVSNKLKPTNTMTSNTTSLPTFHSNFEFPLHHHYEEEIKSSKDRDSMSGTDLLATAAEVLKGSENNIHNNYRQITAGSTNTQFYPTSIPMGYNKTEIPNKQQYNSHIPMTSQYNIQNQFG